MEAREMGWEARIGDQDGTPLSFVKKGQNTYTIDIDGDVQTVVADELQPGLWLLNVGGRIIEAGVTPAGDALEVSIHGKVVTIDVSDPRRRALSGSGANKDGPQVIKSPMPGKVIGVLVEVGQLVEEGQGLVVVEAMKMENEYKAPIAGRVSAVDVVEGQTLEAGAKLVRIDPVTNEA